MAFVSLLIPYQVKGVISDNIGSDIELIQARTETYKAPAKTKSDLGVGSSDGEVRLVLDEDIFYVWDSPTVVWKPLDDKTTELRRAIIPIPVDCITHFTTELNVGCINGIASINAVDIEINGLNQTKGVDYELGVTGQSPSKLIITWKSSDFTLETTDTLTVVYDILLI